MPTGSGSRAIGAAGILAWLQRNSATDQANRTARDAWHSYLVRIVAADGTLADLEIRWLRTRIAALGGASAGLETNADLWNRYLDIKGFSGNLTDKFNSWIDHGTA